MVVEIDDGVVVVVSHDTREREREREREGREREMIWRTNQSLQ